jgi:hypothetical protein
MMVPVTGINPCAANDAVVSVNKAPADGFFVPAPFRGGFSPYYNWLEGWTAVDAYGMTDTSMNTAKDSASTLGGGGSADLDSDGDVDFGDFSVIAGSWLQGK